MNIPPRNTEIEERIQHLHRTRRYEPYTRRLMNRNYIGSQNLYNRNIDEIKHTRAALKNQPNNNNYFIESKLANYKFLREQLAHNAELGQQYAKKQKVLRNITTPGAFTLKKTGRNVLKELQRRALSEGIVSQPVEILPTLDDGDCFYSSIYRAAKERSGLLERLSVFLELSTDSPTEDEFIDAFRQKVADKLLIDSSESELYPRLKEVSKDDPESYKEMMEQYPAWFVHEFGKTGKKLGTKDEFYENFLKHIVRRGKWVGQIEVEQVQEMLRAMNIRLYILRTIAYELPPREGGMDILWLYNPSEAHYEYFSFHEPSFIDSPFTNSLPNNSTNSNVFNRFSNNESNKNSKKKLRKTRRREKN